MSILPVWAWIIIALAVIVGFFLLTKSKKKEQGSEVARPEGPAVSETPSTPQAEQPSQPTETSEAASEEGEKPV